MTGPRRVAVAHRSPHHTASGGHAGGLAHLGPDAVVDGLSRPLPYRVAKVAARGGTWGYDSTSVQREWEAWRTGAVAVHYASAEHDARWLPRLPSRRRATSAWFHNPVEQVAEVLARRPGLRRLNRAWAVSDALVALLAEELGPDRVGLLRHGVETAEFRPGPSPGGGSRPTLLTVGVHLRDWDQHRRVTAALRQDVPDVEARIVAPGTYAGLVPSGPGIVVRHDVPDAELVAEYQAASVVFLPLRDATVNGALLEALACGCAVVATDVGGVAEYAAGAAVLVPPGDDEAAVAALARLLADADERRGLGLRARARGEELDWARVSEAFRWPEPG